MQVPCESCRLVSSSEVIPLEGGWTLNHLNGEQGFLGWMVLQPTAHRMEFTELTGREAQALGPNIQQVDAWLHRYWLERFPNDPLQRVYVVYFFESAFEDVNTFHLHIHMIPRTRLHGLFLGTPDGRHINAWDIYKLGNLDEGFPPLPECYRKYPEAVAHLMDYLRKNVLCTW